MKVQKLTETISIAGLNKDNIEKYWNNHAATIDDKKNILMELYPSKLPGVTQEMVTIFDEIFKNYGFNQSTNPFLVFLQKVKFVISTENLISLYNAITDGYITQDDLKGIGENRDSHVLYNKGLYNLGKVPDTDTFNFVLQAYAWLSNPQNLKTYAKRKNMKVNGTEYNIEAAAKGKKDLVPLRDAIIFEGASPTRDIRNPDVIEKYLAGLEKPDTDGVYEDDFDDSTKTITVPKTFSDEWSRYETSVSNNGATAKVTDMSRSQLLDLIGYLSSLI